MKNILVCTDGSPHGNTATQYALHVAKALNASLRGLHVIDIRWLEGPLPSDIAGWIGADAYMGQLPAFQKLLHEKGAAVLEALRADGAAAGLEVETVLRTGHPAHIILDEARQTDLVVLGQCGEHAEWSGDLIGSVTDRISRRAKKPVLITPAEFRAIRRILSAYDGSEHARHALEIAADWAQSLKAALILVSVAERDNQLEQMQSVLQEGRNLAAQSGITVAESLCLQDSVPSAILGTAYKKHCDLLTIGAYGHSRVREWVLGSNTATLINRARIPVLLVPLKRRHE